MPQRESREQRDQRNANAKDGSAPPSRNRLGGSAPPSRDRLGGSAAPSRDRLDGSPGWQDDDRGSQVGSGEGRSSEDRTRARGVWSGSITFGLVTVPVELYSAERRAGVSLRMLSDDGVPLVRRYFCPAHSKMLEHGEIERGFEIAGGQFVVITDEELEALAPRRSRDIEILRFVDRAAIDPSYFVRSYFLVPGAEQTKAYRLLADVMEASGRAAIASFVMREKSYAVAIFADRGILRAETLRFQGELRDVEDVGLAEPPEVDHSELDDMRNAVEALSKDDLDEAELNDPDAGRLWSLAREKYARRQDVVEAPPTSIAAPSPPDANEPPEEQPEVVDLMALLKQRLSERATAPETPARAERAPRRRPASKGVARRGGTRARSDRSDGQRPRPQQPPR